MVRPEMQVTVTLEFEASGWFLIPHGPNGARRGRRRELTAWEALEIAGMIGCADAVRQVIRDHAVYQREQARAASVRLVREVSRAERSRSEALRRAADAERVARSVGA